MILSVRKQTHFCWKCGHIIWLLFASKAPSDHLPQDVVESVFFSMFHAIYFCWNNHVSGRRRKGSYAPLITAIFKCLLDVLFAGLSKHPSVFCVLAWSCKYLREGAFFILHCFQVWECRHKLDPKILHFLSTEMHFVTKYS